MTPQEKAQELIDKYLNAVMHFPYIDSEDGRCIGTGYMVFQSAKQCALIAIEEVLSAIKNYQADDPEFQEMYENYYEQIKAEINKL